MSLKVYEWNKHYLLKQQGEWGCQRGASDATSPQGRLCLLLHHLFVIEG